MARTTMIDLISRLRGMTQTTQDDWTSGTAVFWDANQIQLVLDMYRTEVNWESLTARQQFSAGGSVYYLEYYSQYQDYESTNGGTAIFYVQEAGGSVIGTASYTPDYMRGLVTFGSDTGGSAYYLTGTSFDLNGAAAYIWRQKAAYFATTAFDFSTDNHSIKRSQLVAQALQMAEMYEGRSNEGSGQVDLFRSDLNVWTE